MNKPDPSRSSMDTSASWGQLDAAPRGRDLTGANLGDFQVERLLGRGGMGEVYLARQLSLNREVALKVLRPDLLTNPTYIARFEAESWSAAKLNHPNIVHIYTVGISEGLRFIAMEYVQGTNLREYLTRKGTPELLQAISIMRQAGAAVGAAGEVGLVHRDIKPENLLLTRKGQVKVADFGLCRDLDSDRHHVTQTGITLGTPLYMSPEQARGMAMDHRSDLYSLGVTYYHMLAGQPPFRADTALALAMKHVSDAPVDLAVHRPDLPPDLTKMVMRLMAKSPSDRYQSAAEMLRTLAKVREALQITALTGTAGVAITDRIDPSLSKVEAVQASREHPKVSGEASSVVLEVAGWLTWPSRKTMLAAGLVGLLAGAWAGWTARPPDLLAPAATPRAMPPVLWLAPDWATVTKKASPAEQYRYALIQASPREREAAWVAVSGYFPQDQEWASRSFAQIGRELFRKGDRDRLETLADVLASTNSGRNKALSEVIDAAVASLEGDDIDKVLNLFDGSDFSFIKNLLDASVANFGLEVILRIREDSRLKLSGTVLGKLREVEGRLIRKMIEIKQTDLKG